jgi:hypothetical protein
MASSSGTDKLFFKFPLDSCTPGGSTDCITRHLSGAFSFAVRLKF